MPTTKLIHRKYLRSTFSRSVMLVKMVKIIVGSNCSGCETCVNSCPVSVYEIRDGMSVPVKVEECLVCRTCESNCPEGAIQIIENEETAKAVPPRADAKQKKTRKPSPKAAKSKKKTSL